MFDLLILYELNKSTLTMYGISKEIKSNFSMFTLPSFGTISPTLSRLRSAEFIKSQKIMSEGGRLSVYYSITDNGKEHLKKLLLEKFVENPVQFPTNARIRLICAEVLEDFEKMELFKLIKRKAESITADTNNLLKNKKVDFLHKIVCNNLVCEYNNLISLIEGLEHDCKS